MGTSRRWRWRGRGRRYKYLNPNLKIDSQLQLSSVIICIVRISVSLYIVVYSHGVRWIAIGIYGFLGYIPGIRGPRDAAKAPQTKKRQA